MAVPNLWRTKEQRYRLQGDICPACNNTIFPPKRVCPHCQHGGQHESMIAAIMSEQQEFAYVMLFESPQIESPQIVALNAVGDD